jgi:hypothetical protein
MRTTLVIDDMRFSELREYARENDLPFREAVNEILRAGMRQKRGGKARLFGRRPAPKTGLDPATLDRETANDDNAFAWHPEPVALKN